MAQAQYQQVPGEVETKAEKSACKSTTRSGRGSHEKSSIDQENHPKLLRSESQGKPSRLEKDQLPRDLATGRELVEDGGSCLRCIENGLRCTLKFLGLEGAAKCAGCKRSGNQYCVRQRVADEWIPFQGPPWHNPNFFAVGDEPSQAEMEEILYNHYEGQDIYLGGSYISEGDRRRMILPPFNGRDLPLAERQGNWQTMDWQRVLPVWKNRSFHPRSAWGIEVPYDIEEIQGIDPYDEEAQVFLGEDTLQYLRVIRKYQPRRAHMKELISDLGETW
ncbi:hypothetical protein F4804DRAFT_349549 [Jackrogersella minutella]|nr:hypothetical protein F4804DRAFT_349549 [Jackrogersella minutella]